MRLRTTSRRPTLVLDQLLRMQASELCAMAREILAYVERAGDEPTAQAYACEQIRDALIEAATLCNRRRVGAQPKACAHCGARRRTVRELGRNAAVTYEPAPRRT